MLSSRRTLTNSSQIGRTPLNCGEAKKSTFLTFKNLNAIPIFIKSAPVQVRACLSEGIACRIHWCFDIKTCVTFWHDLKSFLFGTAEILRLTKFISKLKGSQGFFPNFYFPKWKICFRKLAFANFLFQNLSAKCNRVFSGKA
jgi:hypothetical protein